MLLHTKIFKIRGLFASGLVWPSKWVGQDVMANRMHRQGLDGRPQKNLAFFPRNPDHPKNGVLSHTKIVEMRGMVASGLVDLPNGFDNL